MEKLDFKNWLKDFQSHHKFDKDGGDDELKHLKGEVSNWSAIKKEAIIDEFILNEMIVHACELIQLYGNDSQKKRIRAKFSEYIKSKSNEYIGQELLMTILKTFDDSDLQLLEEYFSVDRSNWFRVPAELYEINKNLFLKAFQILLNRTNDDRLYNYDGFLYLIYHIEMIAFLIDNLNSEQSNRIKAFCRIKSKHPCVNNDNWKQELLKLG